MSYERDDRDPRGGEEVKHKYRLNKRKFAVTISLLCFAVAAIMIAVHYVRAAGEKEAVAALNPPLQTQQGKPTVGEPRGGIAGKHIVVDAGHGGFDPGAEGASGTREDGINLKVAFLLKEELESLGARVTMTRTDENAIAETKDLDMAKRREVIIQSASDIVVSVHMNSFPDSEVSGPLVMFMSGSENGKRLADCIISCMNENLRHDTDGKTRSENDKYILKSGYQPCVIVECGYISNPREEEKLLSEDYQSEVAKAISEGVAAYFNN